MRSRLAALALLLTSCASDLRPIDAGPPDDAITDASDVAAVDAGTDAGALDVPDTRTPDREGPIDTGGDVITMPDAPDVPAADAAAVEAGADVGDAGGVDVPEVGASLDVIEAGTVPTDTGVDAGADAPDVRDAVAVDVADVVDAGVDASTDRPDVPPCTTGFGDCDGNPANGCETDTRTSAAHCGLCGLACVPGQLCAGGVCVGPVCSAGYGNCDGNPANGCETDTRTSAAHCGMCGHACTAGQLCVAGDCTTSCPNDAIRCTGDSTGVERCVGGAWALARVCSVTLSGAGASSACYLGACVSCRGVDGGPSCGPATCDGDEDCYRSGWARCIDGRCARRGILPCSAPSDCLPWVVTGTASACTADVRDLNGDMVRACSGSVVGPCTADHQCPRDFRCELRNGRCVAR